MPSYIKLTYVYLFQRNAEISQNNFILVVGGDEMENRSVNVRNRDDIGQKVRAETIPLDSVLEKMVRLKEEKRLDNKLL